MYHHVVKPGLAEQGWLHSAMLELTYACNLDCFFCYNDRGLRGRRLELNDYLSLLDDLAAMQVLFLCLTGGEPLVHKDFFAIGRAARERGFVIRIKTGGHGLRGRIAERVKREVDPLETEISLHGATRETHERQTRVAGSFDRLIDAIPELVELGLRPRFVTTLTAWNEHQIADMFALADRLGVPLRFQGPVGPRDDGDRTPLQIQPSTEGWTTLLAIAAERRTRTVADMECAPVPSQNGARKKGVCGAGTDEVLIDPFGSVFPCLHLRSAAGNVHDESIRDIWRSHVFRDARRLSRDAADRVEREGPLSILGAPMYCPGLEQKGCSCSSQPDTFSDRLTTIGGRPSSMSALHAHEDEKYAHAP
ncbi:MAG: radical SAM protein [Acidobacteriota bacterium]